MMTVGALYVVGQVEQGLPIYTVGTIFCIVLPNILLSVGFQYFMCSLPLIHNAELILCAQYTCTIM